MPGDHFQSLFLLAPISLWEQDFSGIKRFYDELRARGVSDLDRYFDQHPDDIETCMRRIRVERVNERTLEMFGAESFETLRDNLDKVFRDEMRLHFRAELLSLWNGALSWQGEGVNYTLQGDPINIRLHWRILPECGENWECVLVAIENITALKQAEGRFRSLFQYAPISLWEEDYAQLKELFDQLRLEGITDLQSHLNQHPQLVDRFMSLIRVLDVNQKTLELFGAPSKEALLTHLDRVFRDQMRQHFAAELLDMWNGKTAYEREGVNYALTGDPFHVHLDWRLMPGHEQDFGWVLVAVQDISARKKAEEYLRYLGTHDVMTGLYNRAYFEEQLQELDSQPGVSVLMADLDGLKQVNDRFGHQAGDNFVRRAAEVLRSAFDDGQVVARIGGDEFAVLLPACSLDEAQKALERVLSLVPLNNQFYQGPTLNLSMGAATRHNDESLESTMHRADAALYEEKARHHHRRSND